MRLYLLADYLRCDFVAKLASSLLSEPRDASLDMNGAVLGPKAVNLAWDWLRPGHPMRQQVLNIYYDRCSAAEFERAMGHLCQDFVDLWLRTMYERGD